jgi:CubicO group peptidase (beta-lactamase class C family)
MPIRFLIFACIFSWAPLFCQPSIEAFDRWIEETRMKNGVPGLSVAVVKGDKILLLKGYGIRSIGSNEPVDEHTHFQLASVSKTFTAASLALLVDEEDLSWDKPLSKVFPEIVLYDIYATRYANAKDLLAHRTGLPAFRGDLLGQVGYPASKILHRVRYLEPETSFREKALYSNVGFFIAGELAAYLFKMPWTDVCREKLLKPLQMNRSGFYDLMEESNSVSCHALIDGKVKKIACDPSLLFASAGGVVSTANDMSHWLQMLLKKGNFAGKTLLKSESVEELFTPAMVSEVGFSESAPIDTQSGFSYSLGFNVYNYLGKKIVEKGGALDGVRSVITMIPELDLGIVVLANLNLTLVPERIRAKFLEIYVGKSSQDIEKALDHQQTQIAELFKKPQKSENALPLARPLDSFTGIYESPLYGRFAIENAGGTLKIFAGPGGYPGSLELLGNTTFILSWPSLNAGTQNLTFTLDSEGNPQSFTTETLGIFQAIH